MASGIPELVMADIMEGGATYDGLKDISIANGYRLDYKGVSKILMDVPTITSFPSLAVMFGDGDSDSEDTKKGVFREHILVVVEGYVKSDTLLTKGEANDLFDRGEIVLDDLKTWAAQFVIANLNTAGRKYLIEGDAGIFKLFRIMPVPDSQAGIVGLSFKILCGPDTYA